MYIINVFQELADLACDQTLGPLAVSSQQPCEGDAVYSLIL